MTNNLIGVIHGKFQVLHKGHMEFILAAKSKCNFLYIGITNPDPFLTSSNLNDINRSKISSNPLKYFERMEMIKGAVLENKINRSDFEIVPFPINFPDRIKYYVPLSAMFYLTIYDDWGWHKKSVLDSLGVSTNIMWVKTMAERFTSGTEVRKLIANDQKWSHLVPSYVYNYINKNDLSINIKNSWKQK